MDAASLYEEDFHAWSEQQSAVLRRLPRNSVPNDLDLEHIAEEIEGLGKAQRAAVKDLLQQGFIGLVKLAISPRDRVVGHWAREVDAFRSRWRTATAAP